MKVHLVNEIVFSLLAAVGFGGMAMASWQMFQENEAMMAAAKNGPTAITCAELSTRDDLTNTYVRLTDLKNDGKVSFYRETEGDVTNAAYVAIPDKKNPGLVPRFPVVILERHLDPQAINAFLVSDSHEGMLNNFKGLDFPHLANLQQQHPKLDFDRCYVLRVHPPNGSPSVRNHAIVFMATLIPLSFAGFVYLFWSLIRALKHGVTVKPDRNLSTDLPRKHVANLSFNSRPVEFQELPTSETVWLNSAQRAVKMSQLPKPKGKFLLNALMFGSISLPVLAGFAFVPGVVPMGVDVLLVLAALACISIFFFVLAQMIVKPENHCRIKVDEGSLSWGHRRFFDKMRSLAQENGFEHITTEVTNLVTKQVTHVFRSSDGATVMQISKGWATSKSIAFYSLVANGKVFLTIDIDLPDMYHPLLGITTGLKGKLKETLSIHQQIARNFEDVVVTVEEDEVGTFTQYTDTLEQVAAGLIAKQIRSIPPFRSLIRKVDSDKSVTAKAGARV